MDDRKPLELGPFTVGDEKTVTIKTTNALTGAASNPSSAKFAFWDEDKPITGTADDGSTTTIVDATLNTYSDDKFNGIPLSIRYADGTARRTIITDFTGSSGTLTFPAQPEAVAADDEYEIEGFPLLALVAAGSITGNSATVQLTGSNVLAYEGDFPGAYWPNFGTDAERMMLLAKVRVPRKKSS